MTSDAFSTLVRSCGLPVVYMDVLLNANPDLDEHVRLTIASSLQTMQQKREAALDSLINELTELQRAAKRDSRNINESNDQAVDMKNLPSF